MDRRGGTPGTADVGTTKPSQPLDAPAPHGQVVGARGRRRRPHVFPLFFGLIDARVGGVEYLDTIGGDELRRLLREWGPVHTGPAHRSDAPGESQPGG
jgi:hypothetical protein